MHEMTIRETICQLQLTCRLFYEICTPIIYQNCYILSTHGYYSYLKSINSFEFPKRKPRKLLLSGTADDCDPRPLIENLQELTSLHLLVDGWWSPTIFELPTSLVEYAGQLPQFTTPLDLHDRFRNLRRLCLIDNSFVQQISINLGCPNLEEVVLIAPFGVHSTIDLTTSVHWLTEKLKLRSCNPRITVLSPLAKTIDNPGFRRIQDINLFLDNLARSIHMVDLQLYRLNSEHEGPGGGDSQRFLTDLSPFQDFVERSLSDGTLFDYCRKEGRRCGQSTSLGLALVPW